MENEIHPINKNKKECTKLIWLG